MREVLNDIGAKGKAELLLLNKIDTPDGETAMPNWRAMHPDALPISARAGLGLDRLAGAVLDYVRGQQHDVTLACDVTNGRLISYIEAHARIHDRRFVDDDARVEFDVTVGKNTLRDLLHVI